MGRAGAYRAAHAIEAGSLVVAEARGRSASGGRSGGLDIGRYRGALAGQQVGRITPAHRRESALGSSRSLGTGGGGSRVAGAPAGRRRRPVGGATPPPSDGQGGDCSDALGCGHDGTGWTGRGKRSARTDQAGPPWSFL